MLLQRRHRPRHSYRCLWQHYQHTLLPSHPERANFFWTPFRLSRWSEQCAGRTRLAARPLILGPKKKFARSGATLIENTCNDFTCNAAQIRVAVVTFASSPVPVFDVAYSAANHHSRQDIVDDILTTHYTNGGTATRSAVEHVRDNIFSASHGMRRHSKKNLLVLTDGNHNGGQDPKDVAKSLHERPGSDQVDVFALGIGPEYRPKT